MKIGMVLAPILLFTATAALAGESFQGKIVRSFQARPGGRLSVSTDRGSIVVRPWEKSEVAVDMTITVSGASDDEAKKIIGLFQVDMHETDGNVFVDVDYDQPLRRALRRSPNVFLSILVPREYAADLTTAGGDIQVASLGGRADLRTSGGDVTVRDVKGDVNTVTSGGDIDIAGVAGAVEAKTSGGDVAVRNAAGSVQSETSGGDIRVENAGGQVTGRTSGGDVEIVGARDTVLASTSGGDIDIQYAVTDPPPTRALTSGGDVTIAVAPGVSANLDANTPGGSVECDVPVTVQGKLARGRLSGTLGAGGNLLTLRSSGGSIRLIKR
jgi:DUF4097 and DUF4098 domain-containing protein YvlB